MTQQALRDALCHWGADPVEGIARCVGDEELYASCLRLFAWDGGFEALRGQSTAQQLLETVHTLKGVAGTLSLTPMYQLLSLMVAQLREGTAHQLPDQKSRLLELQAQLQELLK